ncbi:uncharacterized protein LOC117218554 [Megalopta genalis]|uniref:uncharacterized protein LOC117218554 n=1 Tax=Megalopta genalis TaxID=115081 RepID=UPI00144312EA|nr:activating signal cointegrator 1 complex subunit 2 homolog [Megalopta genalis]
MQFFILLLAVAPIYAAGNPLGEDHQYVSSGHIREKRQPQNYAHNQLNQGSTAHIQQLLQAQNVRPPLVNIPPQQIPKLGPSQPIKPQYLNQAQVSQYRPQVSIGNGAQQPNYKKPIVPQQPQYRPPQPANYPQQQQIRPNYNVPQQPQQPQYSSKLPPHVQQLLQFQKSLTN